MALTPGYGGRTDRAPSADGQVATTAAATPVSITLTATDPGGETVVLPFADKDIDPKSVSYFNIFMGAPAHETVIFVDNVRAGPARVAEKALPKTLERPDDELF